MTTRMMKSASVLLAQVDLTRASPRRVGTLAAHEGLMLEVEGFPQSVSRKICDRIDNVAVVKFVDTPFLFENFWHFP